MFLALAMSVVLTAPPQAPPVRSAMTVSIQQAPPVRSGCGCGFGEPCTCGDVCLCTDGDPRKRYDARCAVALNALKPLVVFVGVQQRRITKGYASPDAFVVAHVPAGQFEEHGYPAKCIIVGVPGYGAMHWKATLSADADDPRIIWEALYKKPYQTVQQEPQFIQQFQPSFFGGFGGGRMMGGGNCSGGS